MKIPLTLLAVVAVILGAMFVFAPQPDPEMVKGRTDLPWQISVNPDGSSRVFDLDLGNATLADARNKFGPVVDYAVFARSETESDLEAYFGDVMFGPLKAKVVAKLGASNDEKMALIARGGGRKASPTGDWKHPLNKADHEAQIQRTVTAISYVPGTRGLDAGFIRDRFGKPAATLQENEHAVSWFYPDKGLSILIDDKGREVLEYVPPRDFAMPEGVSPYSE